MDDGWRKLEQNRRKKNKIFIKVISVQLLTLKVVGFAPTTGRFDLEGWRSTSAVLRVVLTD